MLFFSLIPPCGFLSVAIRSLLILTPSLCQAGGGEGGWGAGRKVLYFKYTNAARKKQDEPALMYVVDGNNTPNTSKLYYLTKNIKGERKRKICVLLFFLQEG